MIGLIVLGALVLLWFFRSARAKERAGEQPLLSPSLFRNRTSNLGLVTQNIQWLLLMGTSFVVATYLQVVRGYDAIQTGVIFTAATLGLLASSLAAERLARRWAQRTLIVTGFVVAIAGVGVLLALASGSPSAWAFAPGLLLIGLGLGLCLTPSVNVVQSSFPDERQGEISGLSRSVSNLGSSFGTAVAGTILVAGLTTHAYGAAMITLAVLGLVGLVTAVFLPGARFRAPLLLRRTDPRETPAWRCAARETKMGLTEVTAHVPMARLLRNTPAARHHPLQTDPLADRSEPPLQTGSRDDERRRLRRRMVLRGKHRHPSPAQGHRPRLEQPQPEEIADHVRSPLFFAHIRASTGTAVQQTNCHPFRHGRWMWMHNGAIADFHLMRRDLSLLVDPGLYSDIEGTTDSEMMFYLAITFGLDEDPPGAVARMVGVVERSGRDHGVEFPVQMTVAVSDGERLWAFRYSSQGESRSLFYSTRVDTLRELHPDLAFLRGVSDETRLIVSEPLGDLPGAWNEVPESTYGVVGAGADELHRFVPEPA